MSTRKPNPDDTSENATTYDDAVEDVSVNQPGTTLEDLDVRFVGEPDPELLQRQITIAMGGYVKDPKYKNLTGPVGHLLFSLGNFETGDKDGVCILQGSLTGDGGRRAAAAMDANYILMLDVDTGVSLKELEPRLKETGLLCLVWTTHSHLKNTTGVSETTLINWLNNQGREMHEETLLADLKEFLLEEKMYHPPVLERVTYKGVRDVEKVQKSGDIKITRYHDVEHQPMARLRLLFLLEEPFEFGDGPSRQSRIKLWKSVYEEVAKRLEIPFDASCTDPARLMYTPRFPEGSKKGEGKHEIVLFAGATLDYEKLDDCLPPLPVEAPKFGESSARQRHPVKPGLVAGEAPFVTNNLTNFVRSAGQDFEMAQFMVDSYGEEHIRRGNFEDGRFDFRCPREGFHSEPDDEDTAFHVINASANDGKGFAAWCLHNTCKNEWGGDRLRVLDSVCQDLGIDDAMDLITPEWTPNILQPEHVYKAIEALDDDAAPESLERVYQKIARLDRPAFEEDFVGAIRKKTNVPIKSIRDCIASERQRWKAEAARNKSFFNVPAPEEYATLEEIHLAWGHTKVVEATVGVALDRNTKSPKIFVTSTGETKLLRFPSDDSSPNLTGVTIGHWRHVLHGVCYVETNAKGVQREVAIPQDVLQHLNGDALYDRLPRLGMITRVPIFNAQGQIITAAGYDPILKAYFAPNIDYRPVPTDGTAHKHVSWALDLLIGEAYRDFPFSDRFRNAVDDVSIYTDERDKDGYLKPNLERGLASRANTLVMTLQPFVRPMISGATPMYFIDKSRPGTGAGYLANVVSIAMEGKPATPQRMASNDEEFVKSISASLFQKRPMIFIDNVDGTIDSPALAAAITTGEWTDRLLGKSEMVTVPVEGLWVIGGNNVNFTHELIRRLVPIRLDAGVPNPEDRAPENFKHRMPRDYVNMRPDLVFACHTLIQNWIDEGCPKGKAILSSFEDWSEVMGGILQAAGVEGFLQNLRAFKANLDEEDDTARLAVQLMFEVFGKSEFTLDEFIESATNKSTGVLKLDIGMRARSEQGQRRAVQEFVNKKILGSPFEISLSYGTTIKLQLESERKSSGYRYQIRILDAKT